MKYTATRSTVRVNRTILLTDGPTLPVAYSSVNRKFRAERLHISWLPTDEGGWEITSQYDIKVAGTVLKKDGSNGANEHGRTPETDWTQIRQLVFTAEWEWLTPILEAARPVGAITLPELS